MKRAIPGQQGLILAVAFIAAACLRFTLIGDKSLWVDEATTIAIARTEWRDFLAVTTRSELNMCFYNLLLRSWLRVGSSEAWIRGLSAMFSLATLPVLYSLAKQLISRQAAVLAVPLMAVYAILIQYAQEARGYSLFVLLVTASWWLFVRCSRQSGAWNLFFYTMVNVLVGYTHFYGLLVLPAQLIALLIIRPPNVRRCAACIFISLLCSLPIALFLATRNVGQGDWVREHSTLNLPGVLYALAGSFHQANRTWADVLAAVYYLSILGGFAIWWRRSRPNQASILVLAAGFLAPLGVALAAATVIPLFLPRYLLVCLPPFVLLGAFGVSQFSKALRTCVLAVILVTSLCADRYYFFTLQKEEWRSVCEFLIRHAKRGDTIILYAPLARWPIEYYARRAGRVDLLPMISYPVWNSSFEAEGEYAYSRRFPVPDAALADQIATGYQRVWLILSHDGFKTLGRDAVSRSLQRQLRSHFGPPSETLFYGVKVLLYD